MTPMTQLTIFYDLRCGLCCRVKAWMQRQRAYVNLRFLPFDSPTAIAVLPELPDLDPEGQIVVYADTGEVYQGSEAWITCLWSLRGWRGWARRFSRPEWHPVMNHICHIISSNRLKLSQLFCLTPERASRIGQEENQCEGGTCRR